MLVDLLAELGMMLDIVPLYTMQLVIFVRRRLRIQFGRIVGGVRIVETLIGATPLRRQRLRAYHVLIVVVVYVVVVAFVVLVVGMIALVLVFVPNPCGVVVVVDVLYVHDVVVVVVLVVVHAKVGHIAGNGGRWKAGVIHRSGSAQLHWQ